MKSECWAESELGKVSVVTPGGDSWCTRLLDGI